jgi:hypothetical protein
VKDGFALDRYALNGCPRVIQIGGQQAADDRFGRWFAG